MTSSASSAPLDSQTPQPSAPAPVNSHLRLQIALCMTSFLTAFMGSSLNVAMPFIAIDFNCAPENVTWMISGFTAASSSFLLSASALADRFGYLKIYQIGALCTGILSLGVALSPNLLTCVIMRLLQGVTISLVFCTAVALLSQRMPRELRASAIAYNVAAVYSGLTFSPILAGLLVDTLGWQSMFYITVVGLILSFYLTRSEDYDQPNTTRLPLWRMGFSFVIGMVTLLSISGYTSDPMLVNTLGLGLLLVGAFVFMEFKSSAPLLPVKFILKNRVLTFALLASLFHYLSSFSYTLLLSMHLQLIMSYSAAMTGLMLIIQPLLMVVFSSLAGKLTHKFGPQYITITGMLLCTAGILVLLALDPNSSLTLIFVSQVLCGTGFGLFSAPNTIIVMSSVQPQYYALASAVQSISRTVGQAMSTAILTALLHYAINAEVGTTLYVRELSASIHISLLISTAGYVLATIFCFCCLVARIHVKAEEHAAKKTSEDATAQDPAQASASSTATTMKTEPATEAAKQTSTQAETQDSPQSH